MTHHSGMVCGLKRSGHWLQAVSLLESSAFSVYGPFGSIFWRNWMMAPRNYQPQPNLPEGLIVRRACPTDLETLADLILAMAWESEGMRLNPETLRAGIQAVFSNSSLGSYWMVSQDDQPVACTLITLEWSDWHNAPYWWIQSLYIQPEFRGKGYFEHLLTTLESAARQAGARELRLYVETANARAIRVYQRSGFDGEHYRYMSKSLAKP